MRAAIDPLDEVVMISGVSDAVNPMTGGESKRRSVELETPVRVSSVMVELPVAFGLILRVGGEALRAKSGVSVVITSMIIE